VPKKETWREGGGRGGDRYPIAVAIDRTLVFPGDGGCDFPSLHMWEATTAMTVRSSPIGWLVTHFLVLIYWRVILLRSRKKKLIVWWFGRQSRCLPFPSPPATDNRRHARAADGVGLWLWMRACVHGSSWTTRVHWLPLLPLAQKYAQAPWMRA
jgi:hypothetical protein